MSKNSTMADAKQGKSPIEDFYNGSSQSRVVLAKPRLGGFGSSSFGSSSSKSCSAFGSVLRPAQLKPGNNPFLKVSEATDKVETKNDDKTECSSSTSTEDRLKDSQEDPEAPKFVPLGSTNATPRTVNSVPAPAQPPATSSSGFVFGQNLSERVVINENLNNGEASVDHGSTNGTTELLFTSAAASVKDNVQEEAGPSEAGGRGGSGLAEAAAEYERSHAQPPPPTTNYTTTGEEDEINVLQISCRLFAWESGSWRERGRGVLRLNEAAGGGGAARLVGRVAGSLRVVLNTRLWPDMVVERAAAKSLRITAADAQHQIKLFLIMGAPGDITQLNRALLSRIAVTKRMSNCAQNSASHRAAERLEAAVDDLEFLDKASDDAFAQDDESSYDDKPCEDPNDAEETADNDRLDAECEQNPDDKPSADEDSNQEKETKALKRKEPAEDETSPKRQCPQILIE